MNITDSWEELTAEAKRKVEEVLNSFEPQAKFKYELTKSGVREFSLNECKVAATPENFRELERKRPLLTESECHAIKTVIHEYFM